MSHKGICLSPPIARRNLRVVCQHPEPQIEIEEQVVEVPVAKHVQVPMIQKVQKMVEVPQVEYDDQVVDVPVQKQVHIPFQQARATCAKAPKVYKHQP